MLRLFPEPGGVEISQAYAELGLRELASDAKPYLIVNMVSTVDGQGRLGEDTGDLGNEVDAALFAQLREQVDCVMAGSSTIGVEQYKAPAAKSETREQRAMRGLKPRPVFATVSRSGHVPWDAPLFRDPDLQVAIFSDAGLDTAQAESKITQLPMAEPAGMLAALASEFDVATVLLEGGPHLNTPFFAAGVADELFLTLAPVLTGAQDPPFPIIAELLPTPLSMSVVSALLDEDHLFLRYRLD